MTPWPDTLSRGRWVIPILVVLQGCSAATLGAFAQGFAAGAGAGAPTKLMLFGGEGHKTYLGCLNCSQYASDSVMNEYGTHGSRYSSESIFNPYGQFGSKYSSYSACNPYASDPPVIVDEAGNFYGRLTVNRYSRQAMQDKEVIAWLTAVCTPA